MPLIQLTPLLRAPLFQALLLVFETQGELNRVMVPGLFEPSKRYREVIKVPGIVPRVQTEESWETSGRMVFESSLERDVTVSLWAKEGTCAKARSYVRI